jgi:hypothetical protein
LTLTQAMAMRFVALHEWKLLHYLRRLSSGLALRCLRDRARYQNQPVSMRGSSIGVLREFRLKDWCVRLDSCCFTWESHQATDRATKRYEAGSAIIFEETRKALL